MSKDELLKVISENTANMFKFRRVRDAVDAYIESTNVANPIVSGSLLLLELMQSASIKNEDGMSVVEYLDKSNGGSVAYLRHDAVVKTLNRLLAL